MPRLDLMTLAADHFENNVSENRFNMHNWKVSLTPECGTVGCFIGHACDVPEINEAGLHLETEDEHDTMFPIFGEEAGTHAVANFFELSYKDACYLFMPGYYATYPNDNISKEDVLYRIREFIKDNS